MKPKQSFDENGVFSAKNDDFEISDTTPNWKDIIAVYAVKVTTAEDGAEVVTVDEEKADFVIFYPHIGGQFDPHPGQFTEYMVAKAVEAGAHVADLSEKILKKKVSGVGLHLEGAV